MILKESVLQHFPGMESLLVEHNVEGLSILTETLLWWYWRIETQLRWNIHQSIGFSPGTFKRVNIDDLVLLF